MAVGYLEIDAMSMTLTRYQENTLAAVKAYFERCAFESPEAIADNFWAAQDASRYVYATIYGSEPRELTVAQQIEDVLNRKN